MCFIIRAKVDFIDIEEHTFNISVTELENKLIIAKKKKKLPKAIIVVHFAGLPCNLRAIKKLKNKYKFKIIEDASHAIGAKYHNNLIGKPIYSDVVVFSFHPVKIITTLEGGCLYKYKKYIN